jgi:hypothetical protein
VRERSKRTDRDGLADPGAAAGATWIIDHLAPLLAVAAATIYAVLRVSYATFYSRFDLDPEEVGLGEVQILVRSFEALTSTVVYALIVVAFFFVRERRQSVKESPSRPYARHWPYLTFIGAAALVLLFSLPTDATRLANKVQKGAPVHAKPFSLKSLFLPARLDVKAPPATITPLGAQELPERLRSRALRFLGESGGTVVLYDYRRRTTLRVPKDSVLVTTHH